MMINVKSVNSDTKMTGVIFRSYYNVQSKGFKMEGRHAIGQEKVDERSRQGEKGQEKSFHDRGGKDGSEGERQTQESS